MSSESNTPEPFKLSMETNPNALKEWTSEKDYANERDQYADKLELDDTQREKLTKVEKAFEELRDLAHEQVVVTKPTQGEAGPEVKRHNTMERPEMVLKYLEPAYTSVMDAFSEVVGVNVAELDQKNITAREMAAYRLYLTMLNRYNLIGIASRIQQAKKQLELTKLN